MTFAYGHPLTVGARVLLIGLGVVLLGAGLGQADCGDGVIDLDEVCDLGGANGAADTCCTQMCAYAALATPCRPVSGSCDVAELCPGDGETCPPDAQAPDGTSCDDANLCTADDRCSAGACGATSGVCGDGHLDFCEVCDDGPANGTEESCCSEVCLGRSYGGPCSDEGDLCTHDVCNGWGACLHLVEPSPGCAMPVTPRQSALKIVAGGPGSTGSLSFKWRRGPANPLEAVGDPGAAPNRLCVYDQDAGGYGLVYQGSASALDGDGAWASTASGWRFSSTAGLPDGITSVAMRLSEVPLRSRFAIKARGALALGPLPLRHRRRVAVQFHTTAGACWGASFSHIDQNDARRFVARSESGTLADVNGDGVREWMIVGDSNSVLLRCAYPNVFADHHPSIVTWNEAVFGAAAFRWIENGWLAPLLDEHQPDAVVIALGTNDLGSHAADQIAVDLRTLYDQVAAFTFANGAHPVPYMATVPPVYPRIPTGYEPKIDAVNEAIRAWTPPEMVVDFDSWMPEEWDPAIMLNEGDNVHLGCGGHARRAEVLEVVAQR